MFVNLNKSDIDSLLVLISRELDVVRYYIKRLENGVDGDLNSDDSLKYDISDGLDDDYPKCEIIEAKKRAKHLKYIYTKLSQAIENVQNFKPKGDKNSKWPYRSNTNLPHLP